MQTKDAGFRGRFIKTEETLYNDMLQACGGDETWRKSTFTIW